MTDDARYRSRTHQGGSGAADGSSGTCGSAEVGADFGMLPTPPSLEGLAPRRFLLAALLAAACGSPSVPQDPTRERGTCPGSGSGVGIVSSGEPDSTAVPQRRVVLMGGGPEDDAAATAFAEGAGGGDVVVLRTSGSLTSYVSYFTTGLSPQPPPSSVTTVLTSPPGAAGDPAVLCLLAGAEAVWLSGGDQWDYLGRWPDTLYAGLAALAPRGVAIGGTSAGAMILGEAAFSARLGTVSSPDALADPLRPEVDLVYPRFAQPELLGVLVDTHFSQRNREGRLLAFLARFLHDRGRKAVLGLGLDEGTAIILEGGRFRVSGRDGSGAWLYEVSGAVDLTPGASLTLEGARRVHLQPGTEGPWPPASDDPRWEQLLVAEGVVRDGV